MTKAQLVDAIAAQSGLTKADSKKALEAFISTVISNVAKESIVIPGFGSFTTTERAERQGVNPSTGVKITIPASKTVKFKAGSELKNAAK